VPDELILRYSLRTVASAPTERETSTGTLVFEDIEITIAFGDNVGRLLLTKERK
jgi:hypothetical protein